MVTRSGVALVLFSAPGSWEEQLPLSTVLLLLQTCMKRGSPRFRASGALPSLQPFLVSEGVGSFG